VKGLGILNLQYTIYVLCKIFIKIDGFEKITTAEKQPQQQ
jgi:hypothetical protein